MRARIVPWVAAAALLMAFAAPVQAKGKVEAKDAFKRALQYYNLGDFKSALDGFKEAYLDYPDPSFLFNIGQCHRQLGQKQEALLAYKAYLREATQPRNRDEVQQLIQNLEQTIHDDELARHGKPDGTMTPGDSSTPDTATTAPPPPPPSSTATTTLTASPPPRHEPVYKKWWLWTIVGVAVVGVGLGVGLGLGLSGSTHFPSATPSDGTIRF